MMDNAEKKNNGVKFPETPNKLDRFIKAITDIVSAFADAGDLDENGCKYMMRKHRKDMRLLLHLSGVKKDVRFGELAGFFFHTVCMKSATPAKAIYGLILDRGTVVLKSGEVEALNGFIFACGGALIGIAESDVKRDVKSSIRIIDGGK
jgi:hypothetical protein